MKPLSPGKAPEVPVKIYAVPEWDLKDRIIGSLAIVRSLRSLERDKAIAKMHKHMATIDDWRTCSSR
jgi:hypothetical protein